MHIYIPHKIMHWQAHLINGGDIIVTHNEHTDVFPAVN